MIIQKSNDVTRYVKFAPRNRLSMFYVKHSKTYNIDAQSAENTHSLESNELKLAIRQHVLFAECITTTIFVLNQLPIIYKLNRVEIDAWNGILINMTSTVLSATDNKWQRATSFLALHKVLYLFMIKTHHLHEEGISTVVFKITYAKHVAPIFGYNYSITLAHTVIIVWCVE